MKRHAIALLLLLVIAGCGGGASTFSYVPGGNHNPPVDNTQPVPSQDGFGLAVIKDASGAVTGVRVSWTRVNVAGVQGYYIYCNTSAIPAGNPAGHESWRKNGGNKVAQSGSGTDTLIFDDTSFTPPIAVGNHYYYRITVVNSTGDESDFSSQLDIVIAQHTVTTVSPHTPVSIGAQVTIVGTYFGGVRNGDKVYFSDSGGSQVVEAASYVSWSATQIVVTVPYGASNGRIKVEVGGVGVLSPVNETVDYAEPVISTINPTEDWVNHDYITLTGTDFGPKAQYDGGNSFVYFDATAATVFDIANSTDNTVIKCKVPAAATGMTINVHITLAGNVSNNISFLLLPHLDSLSATSGNTGASITLTGTNFGNTGGSVTVNGVTASTSSWGNASVVLTIPAAATDGNVVLTRSDTKVANGIGFDVIPTISTFTPSRLQATQQLTINGTGYGDLRSGSTVTFNGGGAEAASYVSWTNNQIVVTVPAGATTGTFTVHINDTSVGSNQDDVTSASNVTIVLAPPDITDVGQI